MLILSGSSETGKVILNNWNLFKFKLIEEDKSEDIYFYKFNWSFNNQRGYITIRYDRRNNKIANSAIIDTDDVSSSKFSRPLGLYNDKTLFDVYKRMLAKLDCKVEGIYVN